LTRCAKSGHGNESPRCPLYPRKQTFGASRLVSALCHKQTCTTYQPSASENLRDAEARVFDWLVVVGDGSRMIEGKARAVGCRWHTMPEASKYAEVCRKWR